MSNTNNAKKQLQWEVSFKRNGDFPLDRSSIFNTYAEAMEYVNGSDGNKKGVPYLGQVITILTSTIESYDESGVYVIKELPNEGNMNQGRIERAGEVVGGDAISVVDGNQVDIILNETEKNYIKKDSNGLSVTGIEANKTTTSKEIQILGGPLAAEASSAFGSKIPSGTSIEDILTKLLCQEIYTSPGKGNGSCTFGILAPSLSSSNVSKNSLVEVGAVVAFDDITANIVTASTTSPYVGKFVNGYRTELDGQTITPNDGYVRTNWSTGQTNNSYYKLELTNTGFTGTLPLAVTATTHNNCKISSFSLTIEEGENILKITESPAAHDKSHSGIPSYYIVSNMGNVDSTQMSSAVTSVNETNVKVPSQSNSFKVTGVYPIFTNGISASTVDSEAFKMEDLVAPVTGDGTKLALMKSGTQFAVSFAAHTQTEGYRLYLPKGWEITSADGINPNSEKFSVSHLTDFEKQDYTVERTIQGKKVDYTVYEYLASAGANRVRFTVG